MKQENTWLRRGCFDAFKAYMHEPAFIQRQWLACWAVGLFVIGMVVGMVLLAASLPIPIAKFFGL